MSVRQDFHPRIYLTDSDFASITHNGKLCDAKGQLGPSEFEDVMRRQMIEMIQDKLVLARGLRTPEVPCAAAACYRTFECGATFRTSEARFMTSGCRAAFLKA